MVWPAALYKTYKVLRGFAALLVIFVHLDELLSRLDVPLFGGAGVDIFFVISGFIMVYTTMDREITPWSFMADRIARIVPSYWIVTFAVFVIAFVAPSLLQTPHVQWSELLESLAFVPFQKANGLTQPVLYVGWTLNYEMLFYLMFAAGLAIPNKRWGSVVVIFCLVCLAGFGFLEQPSGVISKVYTNIIILDFALGMLIGLVYRKVFARVATSIKWVASVLVFLGTGLAVLLPLRFPEVSSFVVCGLPASLVVGGGLLLENLGWAVQAPWLLRLGNASYSIYLVHPFITQLSEEVAARMQPDAFTDLLLMVATLMGVCVAGVMFHHILERPLTSRVRRLLKAPRLSARMT